MCPYIQEHNELANVLGSGWRAQHEGNLERRQQDYFQESWDPVVALLKALRADVKTEVCAPPLSPCVTSRWRYRSCRNREVGCGAARNG